MARRPFRMGSLGPSSLDLFSAGRLGPSEQLHLTRAHIEQIARTVRRTPEVMVKVTGGGTELGKVVAHVRYISQRGKLDIHTDEGERIHGREQQRALLEDWHLELTPGQYRAHNDATRTRALKLVHNIALSMPSPTPPQAVLAAAKTFAREKFGLRHRYAMVLHTHQQHPHVHMVVKAEGLDGRRLHIDKAMLRQWREDFARFMREQGVAANATPRAWRGRGKAKKMDYIHRVNRRGHSSHVLSRELSEIAQELRATGTIQDAARPKVVESRKTLVAGWMKIAEVLDRQGEIELAGDVRYFVRRLPPALTDREKLALKYTQHLRSQRTPPAARSRDREELTR